MKFVIASKNPNKLDELNRILSPIGIKVVSELNSDFVLPNVEENGSTFVQNARLKAVSAMETTGLPAIADDSGLCVDYLNGDPGVFSARFSGTESDDNKNNQKLLQLLKGVPMQKRSAYFVSAVCVEFPDGTEIVAEGKVSGHIAFEAIGSEGFGYDPLFLVNGRSFAQMSKGEKDEVSHRGKALKTLVKKLEGYYERLDN